MESVTIITALLAFLATNLDDMFLLAAFFAHPQFQTKEVVWGQYLGFISLLMISSLAYFAQLIIPPAYISLLGLLPILIGIRNLMSLKNPESPVENLNEGFFEKNGGITNNNIFSVAAVTIANGGDNLGVYMPIFATSNPLSLLTIIVTFLILVGIWCLLGFKLVNNEIIGNKIREYGHLILPFVMIFIGMVIILRGWI
ncbi:MAG: cadmium resistance transporter [Methanobacteriaceae archaeon]|nr:cadmium resistance transporter [Methanobacteriaceae archaeon]